MSLTHVPYQGSAGVSVAFSANEKVVTVKADGRVLILPRPVISFWRYEVLGTTYWVSTTGNDTNPGTLAAPFLTITKALSVAKAGDAIYVRAGTYVESVWITTAGTVNAPIILSCAPGDLGKVKISRPPADVIANPWKSVIHLAGAVNYFWVNGFVLEGPIGMTGIGTGDTLNQCGILMSNGAGLGIRITNNVIYGNTHSGIKEAGHGGLGYVVEGNVVFDNGRASVDHGIYIPGSSAVVNGNLFFNNAGCGIHIYNGTNTPLFNIVTRNVSFGHPNVGVLTSGGSGIVRNNTSVYNGAGMMYYNQGCKNNRVDHNIFAFSSTYDSTFSGPPDNTTNISDYNCVFGGSGYGGGLLPGAHDLKMDPLFMDGPSGNILLGPLTSASGMGAF